MLLGHHSADEFLDRACKIFGTAKPPRIRGTSRAVLAALGVERGPHAAAAAMRLVVAAAPWLARQLNRRQWEVDLARLKDLTHDALDAILAPETASETVQRPASEADGPVVECEPLLIQTDPLKKHARGVVLVQDSAAEGQAFELAQPPGLGSAPSEPAESAEPRPNTPAASPVGASMTPSGWLQSIPKRPRAQQVAQLILAHPVDLEGQSAREAARALLNLEVPSRSRRAGHRELAAVARALLGLQRRGLLGPDWRPPTLKTHEALGLLGLRERPNERAPSERMAASLERRGVDPRGLSHAEAQVVSYRLFTRRKADLWSPRQLAAAAGVLSQRPEELSRVLVDETRQVDFGRLMTEFRQRARPS